jgi:hypothetical protein
VYTIENKSIHNTGISYNFINNKTKHLRRKRIAHSWLFLKCRGNDSQFPLYCFFRSCDSLGAKIANPSCKRQFAQNAEEKDEHKEKIEHTIAYESSKFATSLRCKAKKTGTFSVFNLLAIFTTTYHL